MNAQHDLAVLEAIVAELPRYLLSEVLFWPLGGSSDFPKLSLGMALLTRARLQAGQAQLTPTQQAERDRLVQSLDLIFSQKPVACENKVAQEFHSRLNLWQAFLADCRDEPQTCADNYPQEVTQRVVAELLLRQFTRLADSPEAQRLARLDAQLRPRLQASPFLWPAELQGQFPQNEFWFLYGRI